MMTVAFVASIVLAFLSLSSSAYGDHHILPCGDLVVLCLNNSACNASYQSWNSKCQAVLSAQTTNCAADCLSAWSNLTKDAIGNSFATCKCGLSDYGCEAVNALFKRACLNEIDYIRCGTVFAFCGGSSLCYSASNLYLFSCRRSQPDSCSSSCQYQAKILVDTNMGYFLGNCSCIDGSAQDELECNTLRNVTQACGVFPTPTMPTQKMATQKTTTQKMTTQKMATQNMTTQKIATQKMTTQKMATQKMATQKMATLKMTNKATSKPTSTNSAAIHFMTLSALLAAFLVLVSF